MKILKTAGPRTQKDIRELRETVSEIIENVRNNGDRALIEYGQRFDNSNRENFRVSREEIEQAYSQILKQ